MQSHVSVASAQRKISNCQHQKFSLVHSSQRIGFAKVMAYFCWAEVETSLPKSLSRDLRLANPICSWHLTFSAAWRQDAICALDFDWLLPLRGKENATPLFTLKPAYRSPGMLVSSDIHRENHDSINCHEISSV
jgi:hypothetical protein